MRCKRVNEMSTWQCKELAMTNRTLCKKHLEQRNRNVRNLYARRRKAGTCRQCKNPAVNDRIYCMIHLTQVRDTHLLRYRDKTISVRGPYKCSKCGETGHNAVRHKTDFVNVVLE